VAELVGVLSRLLNSLRGYKDNMCEDCRFYAGQECDAEVEAKAALAKYNKKS
jgi:hypothetical protein